MTLEPYWQLNFAYNYSHRQYFDHIQQTDIANRLAFISEYTVNPYNDSAKNHAERIAQCKKDTGRLPVLSLDTNCYDVETFVTELEQYIDADQFFVLSPDARPCRSTRSNVAPFPSWLCEQQIVNNKQFELEKLYRISYLSGVMRFYRLELFKRIKPFVKDTDVVVVNKLCPENFINTIPETQNKINIKQYFEDLPWASRSGILDTDQTMTSPLYGHLIDQHPAYQSCVNITGETETYRDSVFVTEKTWKAYLANCLVVNFGVDDLSSYLESTGLEIWKAYDQPGSIDHRMQLIVELFQRNDISDLYNQNLGMIAHNRNLVASLDFCKTLAQPAIEKIKAML